VFLFTDIRVMLFFSRYFMWKYCNLLRFEIFFLLTLLSSIINQLNKCTGIKIIFTASRLCASSLCTVRLYYPRCHLSSVFTLSIYTVFPALLTCHNLFNYTTYLDFVISDIIYFIYRTVYTYTRPWILMSLFLPLFLSSSSSLDISMSHFGVFHRFKQ
jgi:hypothetical protein